MRANRSFPICFFKRSHFGLIMLVVLLSLLAGCNLPSPGGDLPTCRPEELVSPPNPRYPGDLMIISTLSPAFTWDWGGDCDPQEFQIEVFNPSSTLPAMISERVPGGTRAWDMDGALQPGNMYTWRLTPRSMGSTGPTSPEHIFMTGPVCSDLSAADYPAPILLAPPDGTVFTESQHGHLEDGTEYPTVSFRMVWDDPSRCVPDGYQIQVSTSPGFPAGLTREFDQDNLTSTLFFFPPSSTGGPTYQECTRYYWRVRAKLARDEYGPFSETWSFTIDTGSMICTTIPVVSPVVPLVPPPESPLSTEAPILVAPQATALQNTNCRGGPGRAYIIDSTLFEGQSAAIVGRNEENTWWLIENPLGEGDCWVWMSAVEATGDLSMVLVVQAPPTQKPEKPARQGCWVFGQNQQLTCAVPCPPNAQPGGECKP